MLMNSDRYRIVDRGISSLQKTSIEQYGLKYLVCNMKTVSLGLSNRRVDDCTDRDRGDVSKEVFIRLECRDVRTC